MTSFENAVLQVKNLPQKPTNDELLKLYGLYKQATVGDNNTSQPGFLDIKGKAKWNSWNSYKGLSNESAKEQYVNFVKELQNKY